MKIFSITLLSIALMSLIAFMYAVSSNSPYHIGDCVVLKGNSGVFKITEVGKYSLKTIRPHYNGYEETIFYPYELKDTMKADCFDLFDNKGESK